MSSTPHTPAPFPSYAGYEARKEKVKVAFQKARNTGHPVRLRKSTSNLFRQRHHGQRHYLDLREFNHVLHINPEAGWADVEGMISYEAAVEALLPHGFMPAVVPELKSITVGGALSGGGIESSSFRYGFVHETVREMDILTGTGDCLTCNPRNEHSELFFGFPCSYGALGYCLRARIQIIPTRPFVRLRHTDYQEIEPFFRAMEQLCSQNKPVEAPVAFIDGSVFAEGQYYLTTGEWADDLPETSDYTGMHIYHRSIREKTEDGLTIKNYLWRWDPDWFWCSRAFGAEHPLLRRVYHHLGLLRSTTYWKLKAFCQRTGILRLLGRERAIEYVIQDVEIPIDRAGDFLRFMLHDIGLLPIWVCPAQSPEAASTFPLYPTDPGMLYINFGFWGGVPSQQPSGYYDRLIEEKTIECGGKKSLYSNAYFEREIFDSLYGESTCRKLKTRYDPDRCFPDRFEKCVQNQ